MNIENIDMRKYPFQQIALIFFSLIILLLPVIVPISSLISISDLLYDSLILRQYFLVIFVFISVFFSIKVLHIEILPLAHRFVGLNPKYSSHIGNILIFHHSHHSSLLQHELKIRDKFFCTGCYGTVTGLICGLIILVVYLIQLTPTTILPLPIVWCTIPFLGTFLGFIKYLFPLATPKTRIIVNFSFGISFPLFLLFIDNLWNSVINDIFAVGILVTIVLLRLYLHRLDRHE